MWSLHHLLVILSAALSCVTCAAAVIQVFGYEGRDVSVSCPYGEGYENYQKYLCRNNCGSHDVLITTSQTNNTKYSIYDDRRSRIFTATISASRLTDAGKYWCGVTRTGTDIYTEVKLEISPDSCCDNVTQIQADKEGSVSIRCSYESKNKDNLKYICRGKQPSTCLQQALTTSNRQNGRFNLTDDRKSTTFTVTIYNLTLEDSGSYLCGVQNNSGLDVFTAVELEVKVSPLSETGFKGAVIYVLLAVPAVLLILAVVVVTARKHRCSKVKDRNNLEAENNHEEVYENDGFLIMKQRNTKQQNSHQDVQGEDEADYDNMTK